MFFVRDDLINEIGGVIARAAGRTRGKRYIHKIIARSRSCSVTKEWPLSATYARTTKLQLLKLSRLTGHAKRDQTDSSALTNYIPKGTLNIGLDNCD